MAKKVSLDSLRELRDDWDEVGAVPPTEAAIDLAEMIINTPPKTLCTAKGGVRIEWRCDDVTAEIRITPQGTVET